MTKRVFRSIFLASLAVLLAAVVLILGALYTYFTDVQAEQLRLQTALAAHALNISGEESPHSDGLSPGDKPHHAASGQTAPCCMTAESDPGIPWITISQRDEVIAAPEIRFWDERPLFGYPHRKVQCTCAVASGQRRRSCVFLMVQDFDALSVLLSFAQPIIRGDHRCADPVCLVRRFLPGFCRGSCVRSERDGSGFPVVRCWRAMIELSAAVSGGSTHQQVPPLSISWRSCSENAGGIQRMITRAICPKASWCIDRATNLLTYNTSAAAQLLERHRERLRWAAVSWSRQPFTRQFRGAIDEALTGNRRSCPCRHMTIGGRTYQPDRQARSHEGEEVIRRWSLLLLDITQKQEQREQLRREFTANVSHELKTPLTMPFPATPS